MQVTDEEYDALFAGLDMREREQERIMSGIIDAVSKRTGVPIYAIVGRVQKPRIVRARSLAMLKAKSAGLTLEQIGQQFGNRDHTSVMAAVKRTKKTITDYAKGNTQ